MSSVRKSHEVFGSDDMAVSTPYSLWLLNQPCLLRLLVVIFVAIFALAITLVAIQV
jgi:hypothetical protein